MVEGTDQRLASGGRESPEGSASGIALPAGAARSPLVRNGPWRYALWLVPLLLFLLNLLNHGYSQEELRRLMKGSPLEDNRSFFLPAKNGGPVPLDLAVLQRALYNEEQREQLEGHTGRIKGLFVPAEDPREGTVVRFKLICCAADVLPLRVQLVSPAPITQVEAEQWVEVTGQVQFRKLRDRDELVPVLQLRTPADVVAVDPDPRPFLP